MGSFGGPAEPDAHDELSATPPYPVATHASKPGAASEAPVALLDPPSPAETMNMNSPSISASARSAALPVEEIHARPASLLRRLAAWLIDGGSIAGVAMLYLSIAAAISGAKAPTEGLSMLDALVVRIQSMQGLILPGVVLVAVLSAVYCTVAAMLWGGRTLGRLLTGIRLVDASGHPPAPGRAIARACLSILSFGLFLSGFWLALFDRKGQTLHDKLTATFVVRPS